MQENFCLLHCQQMQSPPKNSYVPFIILVYGVMCNMASLNLQWEAVTVVLVFHISLFPSVPDLFVFVDIAVKLSNLHERQTCLFLILCFLLQCWGWFGVCVCGAGVCFGGVVLICLEYLFTSAKTDEFWENRDGEALSQLSLCPPLLSLLRLQTPAAQLLSLCEPSGRHAH